MHFSRLKFPPWKSGCETDQHFGRLKFHLQKSGCATLAGCKMSCTPSNSLRPSVLCRFDRNTIEIVTKYVSERSLVNYCLLSSTFPTPLFHTQMCLIFEVLYLTQVLMDSLKSWTAHSPICTLDV